MNRNPVPTAAAACAALAFGTPALRAGGPAHKKESWLRRFVRLALAGVAFVVACNLAVLVAAAGRVTPAGHAAEAPARRAAVVMGCVPKLAGGWDNPYFTARIAAAARASAARAWPSRRPLPPFDPATPLLLDFFA